MNRNTNVRPEWLNAVGNAIFFFLQHTSLEYDGNTRTAKVNYHGPNGWKFSMNTSFNPVIEAENVNEIEGQPDKNVDAKNNG
ncbi:MAG: hypothetical protein SPE66_08405 [Bilifractor sp.]|nr:hypothetical protein [Bilifractor sp.]